VGGACAPPRGPWVRMDLRSRRVRGPRIGGIPNLMEILERGFIFFSRMWADINPVGGRGCAPGWGERGWACRGGMGAEGGVRVPAQGGRCDGPGCGGGGASIGTQAKKARSALFATQRFDGVSEGCAGRLEADGEQGQGHCAECTGSKDPPGYAGVVSIVVEPAVHDPICDRCADQE